MTDLLPLSWSPLFLFRLLDLLTKRFQYSFPFLNSLSRLVVRQRLTQRMSTSKDGGRPPIPAKPENLQKTASSQGRSSSRGGSSRNSSSTRSPEKSTKSQHSSNLEKKSPLKGESSSKPVSGGQTLSPSKGKKNDKPVPSKKAAANLLSTQNRFDPLTDEGDRMDAD